MSTHRIYIIEAKTGSDVEAELDDDVSVDKLLDIDLQWALPRQSIRMKLKQVGIGLTHAHYPQSLHWDWGRKAISLALGNNRDDYRIMGICCREKWESVMVTISGNHKTMLRPDMGEDLVYVDYLEVAPWNWTLNEIGQNRKYKAVGQPLLRGAMELSVAKGLSGRVGLHSLPQAEEFYTRMGFVYVDKDACKQNLAYYELTAAEAKKQMGRS